MLTGRSLPQDHLTAPQTRKKAEGDQEARGSMKVALAEWMIRSFMNDSLLRCFPDLVIYDRVLNLNLCFFISKEGMIKVSAL